jgi:hypothetical protein
MAGNAVIDIVIGLVLTYLILSLICTIANEFIASLTALRAKTLRSGVEHLIDDDGLRKLFFDHGLIASAKTNGRTRDPSYLSGRSVALALLDSLDTGKPVPAVTDLVDAIGKLPDSNVKDALVTAATEAQGDIDKLRSGIAAWFDDSMDRVAGVYKRYMQWITFAVGLALAVLLNVDTVTLAKSLWLDSALRGQAVELAQTVAKSQDDIAQATLVTLQQDLRPLPVGWDQAKGRPDADWYHSPMAIFAKLIGWLITALAISLGAPFWFDLLSRFVSLRTTGNKPAPASTD